MKKNTIYTVIATCMLLFGLMLSSCSKNEDESAGLRKVRYEASGDVGVPVSVQFTPTMETPGYQDFEYEEYAEVSTLPWKKEVLHHSTVHGGFSALVEDGMPGRRITLKIFANEELLGTHEALVGPEGYVSLFMNYFTDGSVQKGGPYYD